MNELETEMIQRYTRFLEKYRPSAEFLAEMRKLSVKSKKQRPGHNPRKKELVDEYILKFNQVRNTRFLSLPEPAQNLLMAILETYTIDEIIDAYRNALNDKFHRQSSFKHLTPEFFTRIVMVEKFYNYKRIAVLESTSRLDQNAVKRELLLRRIDEREQIKLEEKPVNVIE